MWTPQYSAKYYAGWILKRTILQPLCHSQAEQSSDLLIFHTDLLILILHSFPESKKCGLGCGESKYRALFDLFLLHIVFGGIQGEVVWKVELETKS